MKRTIITMMLAGAIMALTIPAAVANSDNSNDSAGYTPEDETAECRPGAVRNGLIGGWETITQEDYEKERIDNFLEFGTEGLSPEEITAIIERIKASSEVTWDFCDKNLDGTLCVLRTDPSPYYYLLLDNRPFTSR